MTSKSLPSSLSSTWQQTLFFYLTAFSLPFFLAGWQVYSADETDPLVSTGLLSDAALYHYSAWFRAVFGEPSYVSDIIAFSPYESLLSFSIAQFGHSNTTPFILNAILSGITCVSLANLTTLVACRRAGTFSILLYLFCTPVLYFAGLTLKTTLVLSLFSLAINCAVRYCNKPNVVWASLFCLFTLVTSIERIHTSVVFIPFLLILLNSSARGKFKTKSLMHMAVCFAIIGGSVYSSTSHFGAEPRYVSSVGLNVYLGHTAPNNFLLKVPGVRNNLIGHRIDPYQIAEEDLQKKLTQSETTEYWVMKTINYISSNPDLYIQNQLQKLQHVLANESNSVSGERPHVWHHHRTPLNMTIVGFGILYALSYLGFITLVKMNAFTKAHVLLVTTCILYLGSLMATIVLERYRLSAIVCLIPLGAIALANSLRLLENEKKHIVFALLICALSHYAAHIAPARHIKQEAAFLASEIRKNSPQTRSFYKSRSTLDQVLNKETCSDFYAALKNTRYSFDFFQVRSICAKLK